MILSSPRHPRRRLKSVVESRGGPSRDAKHGATTDKVAISLVRPISVLLILRLIESVSVRREKGRVVEGGKESESLAP